MQGIKPNIRLFQGRDIGERIVSEFICRYNRVEVPLMVELAYRRIEKV